MLSPGLPVTLDQADAKLKKDTHWKLTLRIISQKISISFWVPNG